MGIKQNNILAVGFSAEFASVVNAGTKAVEEEYSLLLLNEGSFLPYSINKVEVLVCPSKLTIKYPIYCDTIISCGMSANCTLSFSAVGEDTAMLSLTRKVGNTLPGEIRVKLKPNLTLYENLVYQACRLTEYIR